MTPAEKYYTFLDDTWPMNIMIVADLDTALPMDLVAETWARFCRLRSFPRLTAQADLTLRDIGPERVEFSGEELSSDQWHARMDEETVRPYGLDVPLRCRYYVSDSEQRSRVVFIGHHAIVDGRVGVANLQAFIRALDGQALVEQQELSVPADPVRPAGYPWQHNKARLIETLREISRQRAELADVQPNDWPRASLERSPTTRALAFDAQDTGRILSAMKGHDTRALPTMAAAWLCAVREHLVADVPTTLQLGVAVDLSAQHNDPRRPAAMNVGVVTNRFRVKDDAPWALAQDVSRSVGESMDRGDGELLFHLTRAAAIDDLDTGRRVVARSLEGAPPTVSVTNLGIVDPGSDPPWLRWMCGYLAPTPNQLVFVSGLGYRGQLVNSVTTDDLRLPPERAAALVSTFRTSMDGLVSTPEGRRRRAPLG